MDAFRSKSPILVRANTNHQLNSEYNRNVDLLSIYDNNNTNSVNNRSHVASADVNNEANFSNNSSSSNDVLNQTSVGCVGQEPKTPKNLGTKGHFRSFINKKSIFRTVANHQHNFNLSSSSSNVDNEFHNGLFGFRKSITELIHKPVNLFSSSSSKNKPNKCPYSSSSSSSTSSASASASSAASSIPSSPVNRFSNVLTNITNTQSTPVAESSKASFPSPPNQEYEWYLDIF